MNSFRAHHYISIANHSNAALEVLTTTIAEEIAAGRIRPSGSLDGALIAARGALRNAERRFKELDSDDAQIGGAA